MLDKPHVVVWMTLFGNCRIHGNVKMGENVVKY